MPLTGLVCIPENPQIVGSPMTVAQTVVGSTELPILLKGFFLSFLEGWEVRWELLRCGGISNSAEDEHGGFVAWINVIYTLKLLRVLVNCRAR